MFDSRSIPIARIKYKRIITFSVPVERGRKSNQLSANLQSGVHKQAYTQGTLSLGAKKRLRRSIELLVDIAKPKTFTHPTLQKQFTFKLSFLTLTLSAPQQDYSDKQITKDCLQPFLQILRRKYKCQSYIWRAEKQKNGNIHYHITSDVYLPYDQIRDDWNNCQNKLDFINRFEQQHGHRNPNSTDIHSVRKITDLARYMIKYMSKDTPQALTVGCKLWDCSQNLKTKEHVDIILDSSNCDLYQSLKFTTGVTTFVGECFECISMRGRDIRDVMPDSWKVLWSNFLSSLTNGLGSLSVSMASI